MGRLAWHENAVSLNGGPEERVKRIVNAPLPSFKGGKS
jgi:hypothetical protein